MKRFLVNLAIFTPFAIIIYWFLVFQWGEKFPQGIKDNLNYRKGSYGHMYTRLRDVENYSNIDILFLGASDAYRGFDTRIFEAKGYHCFNLGSSSQSPLQTKCLIEDYLKTLNPKTVIYAVSHSILYSDGLESSLDLIANKKIDFDVYKMAYEINHIKCWNTIMYGSVKQFLVDDTNYREPKETEEDIYVSGGYVQKKYLFFDPKKRPVPEWNSISINKSQKKAFESVIASLQASGATVILVTTPMANPKEYENPIWDSVQNYFTSVAPYFNFNNFSSFVDTLHFNDQYHLNQRGVEKFNAMLIDSLLKN